MRSGLQNPVVEKFPFRKVAVPSMIFGTLSLCLGIMLLLTIDEDVKDEFYFRALIKVVAGATFSILGAVYWWRGYRKEFRFNIEEIIDPDEGYNVDLLVRSRVPKAENPNELYDRLAVRYANIMTSRSFSLESHERGKINSIQLGFYKLLSKNALLRISDFLPYPVTNFIVHQATNIAILTVSVIVAAAITLVSYYHMLRWNLTWINVFILIVLFATLRVVRVAELLSKECSYNLKARAIFFITFLAMTFLVYRPYADELDDGVVGAIAVATIIMLAAGIISFHLIQNIFRPRSLMSIQVSVSDLANHRIVSKPSNIVEQFDHTLLIKTGWLFKGHTGRSKTHGVKNEEKDFEEGAVYETPPRVYATSYDHKSKRFLKVVKNFGLLVICAGAVMIFVGIVNTPGITLDAVRTNRAEAILAAHSERILVSLFLITAGIPLYFFGKKLIYEVCLFFLSEVYFESNLIYLRIKGQREQTAEIVAAAKNQIVTNFTSDIRVSKVISSVFLHPYLPKDELNKRDRFVVGLYRDDILLSEIVSAFCKKINSDSGNVQAGSRHEVSRD